MNYALPKNIDKAYLDALSVNLYSDLSELNKSALDTLTLKNEGKLKESYSQLAELKKRSLAFSKFAMDLELETLYKNSNTLDQSVKEKTKDILTSISKARKNVKNLSMSF